MIPAARRCLAFAGLALMIIPAVFPAGDEPARSRPLRPGESGKVNSIPRGATSGVRLGGIEYVDAAAFGARFNLSFQDAAGNKFLLKNAGVTLAFEVDSREAAINGQRVFLGEAVRFSKGKPQLSRIDAESLLTPILRPGTGERKRPALKLIALDPGHGGKDSGKVNSRVGIYEKTAALDMAERLKKLLEAQGYRVMMTRTRDRFVELADRAEIARKAGADLFISLHYNSVEKSAHQVTGVEVFTMTPRWQHSTADVERDDDMVKVDNPGNEHDHWNTLLGYYMHRELLHDLKAPDRGFKRARWAVLRLASCPAVLIEAGYLSSDAEARKIATPAYRQQIAGAIADGVRAYAVMLNGSGVRPPN